MRAILFPIVLRNLNGNIIDFYAGFYITRIIDTQMCLYPLKRVLLNTFVKNQFLEIQQFTLIRETRRDR